MRLRRRAMLDQFQRVLLWGVQHLLAHVVAAQSYEMTFTCAQAFDANFKSWQANKDVAKAKAIVDERSDVGRTKKTCLDVFCCSCFVVCCWLVYVRLMPLPPADTGNAVASPALHRKAVPAATDADDESGAYMDLPGVDDQSAAEPEQEEDDEDDVGYIQVGTGDWRLNEQRAETWAKTGG